MTSVITGSESAGAAAQPLLVERLRPSDPRRLGQYDLLGVLGEGGMGRVFLGRSAASRLVAVKVIRAELAKDEGYRQSFRTEVELAKQVPPFATAEVLDADPDHEPPYLVVEFVDGPSLGDVVRHDGPLSAANLRGVAIGVAAALRAIHDANVIHRDLKPSNILLPHGSPKVIDFGIARPAAVDTITFTNAGSVVGTIAYMAPERLSGDRRVTITSAADIFAWGAVVVFAGTGRDAFASDSTGAVIGRIINGRPDLTGLTEPLLGLVRRALSKDPQHRPTAHDLLETLTRADSALSPHRERYMLPYPSAPQGPTHLVPRPPAETAPIPRQVAAPSRWFVGRVRERAQLTDALRSDGQRAGRVPVAAIVGVGGLGKTWLATRWAYDNRRRFPDGQLYVNLRGFEPGADLVPPAVALAGFLDALGVDPAAVPDDVENCAELFRSRVAHRRMVMVLDNAADSAQVIPLLPGTPSIAVLVTSRAPLGGLIALHGAYTLALTGLPAVDAGRLLERRLGAEQVKVNSAAIDTVVECCAGLPLALSIVAADGSTYGDQRLAALAEDLRLDPSDADGVLRATLAAAYRHLSAEQARLFRHLGAAPGPEIDLAAIASMANLSISQARRQLRQLTRMLLVEEPTPGRFRLHDLIREYAAQRADADGYQTQQNDAVCRLIDFYVRTAVVGDHLLYPLRPLVNMDGLTSRPAVLRDRFDAVEWFATNAACLIAAQRRAVSQSWHRSVWQLAWSLTVFQWRRGQLAHHLAVWQAGLAAAEQLGELPAQAEAHRLIGHVHSEAGRYAEALDHLQLALALSHRSEDTFGLAHAHLLWANIAEALGDIRTALAHSIEALTLVRTTNNPVWQGIALEAVGWCHARTGNFNVAGGYCTRALRIHRKHGYRGGEATALQSLGYIAQSTGHNRKAQRAYSDALALRRDQGHIYAQATLLEHLGEAYRAAGEDSAARLAWQEALSLYQRQFRVKSAIALKEKLAALGSLPAP